MRERELQDEILLSVGVFRFSNGFRAPPSIMVRGPRDL